MLATLIGFLDYDFGRTLHGNALVDSFRVSQYESSVSCFDLSASTIENCSEGNPAREFCC